MPPPFAGDALRAGGVGNTVGFAAPGELYRRVVWHRGDGGNRVWLGQQAQWPRLPRLFPARRRGGDGGAAGGEFRNVRSLRHRPPEPGAAQPVQQRVDRAAEIRRLPGDAALRRRQRLGGSAGQADRLDAEAGIDRGQLLFQQPDDLCRVAAGCREAYGGLRAGGIAPVEPRGERRGPPAGRRPPGAEALGQPAQRRQQLRRCGDRLGMVLGLLPVRRCSDEADRFRGAAQSLGQPQHRPLAETGGQFGAGQAGQFADAADADTAQPDHGAGIEVQGGDRQRRDVLALRVAVAGQAPGGGGGAGNGDTGARQPVGEPRLQPGLAAEQMGAAGDVDQDAVRRLWRGQR